MLAGPRHAPVCALQAVSRNNGLCEDDARWFFTQILFAVDYW